MFFKWILPRRKRTPSAIANVYATHGNRRLAERRVKALELDESIALVTKYVN